MVDIFIPIAVVIAVGFLITCCWFFRPSRAQTVLAVVDMMGLGPEQAQARAQPTEEPTRGLDKQSIDSYPRVVVEASGPMLQQDDYTCPICLNKYDVNDVIKILPQCLHRFHAHCLDEWLSKNATCPVCRIQAPSLNPLVS